MTDEELKRLEALSTAEGGHGSVEWAAIVDTHFPAALAAVRQLRAELDEEKRLFDVMALSAASVDNALRADQVKVEVDEGQINALRSAALEAKALLEKWCEGAALHDHDDGCSEDQDCDCSLRPLCDAFNATHAKLAALTLPAKEVR